jgi:hypothetical protein
MQRVDFGYGTRYDDGTQTGVALNAAGAVLEVHKSENEDTLWCRVGTLGRATIAWGPSVRYDGGRSPACALNGRGAAVEVHRSQNDSELWCRVGSVSGSAAAWKDAHKYDAGSSPAVALNDAGVVVEVHKSENEDTLWYHVGSLSGDAVSFGGSRKYDSGRSPSVAVNGAGVVVEVHQSENEDTLWYRVGTLAGDGKIDFGPSRRYDDGVQPAVALTDQGVVVEVHRSQNEDTLWSRSGVVEGDSISWSDSARFDDGESPAVACNGRWAVQTHRSGTEATLWASAALLMDRSRWMSDNLGALSSRTLRQVAVPGSHDAGMYRGDFVSGYGQTQDTGLYGQLSQGSRYFDLRPEWKDGEAVMHHGTSVDIPGVTEVLGWVGVSTDVDIVGPPVSELLADVQHFMKEGHRELVILKFSHFSDFNDARYASLAAQVAAALGPWLFTGDAQGRRLAEIPLGELLGGGGKVAVAMDTTYFADHPTNGILVYRNEDNCEAARGQLRVCDHYSGTSTYDDMKRDQLQLFAGYDGKCHPKESCGAIASEDCDLFLLSWTLTPDDVDYATYDMAEVMRTADRKLAAGIQEAAVPNARGERINVVFLDYVGHAGVVEVCLGLNGLL